MYPNSAYSFQMMDPSNNVNVEITLPDAPGQMARSQLQRHISNSSSILRRKASRVTKPTSTGNSPQIFQRRRATTQTIPRQQRASLYQQCLQGSQGGTELGQQRTLSTRSMSRPVSWHPSTFVNDQQRPPLNYNVPLPSYNNPYTTYNFNGVPTLMTQAELDLAMTWSPSKPMDYLPSLYHQSADYQIQTSGNPVLNASQGGYSDNSCSNVSPSEQASEGYPMFSPMPYPTYAWPSSISTLPAQTVPPTPEFVPLQNLHDTWQAKNSTSLIPKKESKELVGMGLHDGPDRNSWSLESMLDGPTNLFSSNRPDSMGKGLKLEETWEPPEEEDETDNEEEDDEEAEGEQESEAESDDPTGQAVEGDDEMIRLAEGALGLGNRDEMVPQRPPNLSNHSFFFESDDSYTTSFSTRNMWQGEIADYCVR